MQEIPINTYSSPTVILDLIYRLKVKDVMYKDLVCASMSSTLREIQHLMKKEKINNSFFDLLAIIYSFFLSIGRSIKNIFTLKKTKKNIFFNFLDFFFRQWPKYFWKKPTFYKLTSFV